MIRAPTSPKVDRCVNETVVGSDEGKTENREDDGCGPWLMVTRKRPGLKAKRPSSPNGMELKPKQILVQVNSPNKVISKPQFLSNDSLNELDQTNSKMDLGKGETAGPSRNGDHVGMERPYIAIVEQVEQCLGVVAPGPSHVSLKDSPAGLTKHGSIKSSRPLQSKKAKPFTSGIAQPKTKKAGRALSLHYVWLEGL